MKRLLILIGTILYFSSLNTLSADENINISEIQKAMQAELDRSMNELSIDGLEKPYFIEYTIKVRDYSHAKATLGSLLEKDNQTSTILTVGVRVGDYQFDQTNFFDINLSFFGSSDDEERYKNRQIPNDLDYEGLRRELWLATDVAYKHAAELYSKKKSAVTNRAKKDTIQDFLMSETLGYSELKMKMPSFDLEKYSATVKEVSNVFTKYDKVNSSSAGVEYIETTTIYANTEGTKYDKTDYYTGFEIVAFTKDSLGMPIYDYKTAYSNDPDNLISIDSLKSLANVVAKNLTEITKASDLPEPYSGPVLFLDEAAAEILSQGLGNQLIAQRKDLTEGGFGGDMAFDALQNKIGARVVPEYLSLYNLTDITDTLSSEVVGNYSVDDYGYNPKRDTLIKNGYLSKLLSSRVPNRRVKESSGSKREGGVMYSTLLLENHDVTKRLTKESLIDSLLFLAKKRDLEYAIIVEKILNPNIQFTSLYSLSNGDLSFVRGEGNYANVIAYKVFHDGRKEIIKPTKTINMGIRSFKEIMFTGKEHYVYNFLASAVESPYISGGSQYLESTVITPSLLFEDCEIDILNTDYKKPPIVESPLSTK